MKRQLTIKQRHLIKGLAKGKTMTRAAVEAGYGRTPEAARVSAAKMLRKPTVSAALEAALDKAGATLEKSAQVIAEAHAAQDLKAAQVVGKKVPDHPTRLKAAELNFKARRLVGAAGEEGAGTGAAINLVAVLQIVKQSAKERGLPL